jgi:dTDP-glucose 4,6-dehydratase
MSRCSIAAIQDGEMMSGRSVRKVVVTGGAGFIGSTFARLLLELGYEQVRVFDKLTYAGNPENFRDLEADPRFSFVQGDICDREQVDQAIDGFDAIVNFAAETHVDRSLLDPGAFIQTDVYGVFVLLEAVRSHSLQRMVHVSTDEVYGQVSEGSWVESDPLKPRNPYSASKAGGEMMVGAYVATHNVPAIITRGSNTYGPYQYPEKFLPLATTNVLEGEPIPLYGDGMQVRDWLHARDHAAGVELVLRKGTDGEVYNIAGGNERHNIEIARVILDELDAPPEMIRHVTDRKGHDRRYSMDCSRIEGLGWKPEIDFETGLRETIRWYRDNPDWWKPLKSGEFREYYRSNYAGREVVES